MIKIIWIPILFQIGTILVVMTEIVIPSMGILSIIAVGLFGYSWYYILTELPQGAAWVFLIADVLALPFVIKMAIVILKTSPLTYSKNLDQGAGLDSKDKALENLVGKTGIVESQLHPTGKAVIDNKLLEVYSEDGLIEKNTQVKVVEVTGNKIIVQIVSDINQTTGV